ncbi:MAG: retropepsin-like domain-containing protein [Clostridiales bacterium]|nr:retropepsin-like domain-containing protein [Clostridiales bacterium]
MKHSIKLEAGKIIVPMNIQDANLKDMSEVDFKVDTGSDYTTISKKELYTLGYSADWIKQNAIRNDRDAKTADGSTIPIYFLQIPKMNILGTEVSNMRLHILLDGDGGAARDLNNLLGLDLLLSFNYMVNNDEDEFIIHRTTKPSKTKTIYPEVQLFNLD